jgi:hypothetical protein
LFGGATCRNLLVFSGHKSTNSSRRVNFPGVLGAAGLLKGRSATTHWAFTELLPLVGATYEKEAHQTR